MRFLSENFLKEFNYLALELTGLGVFKEAYIIKRI